MTVALVALQVPSYLAPVARSAAAADGPDLIVTSLTPASTTLQPGGSTNVTWTIKNQGTQTANAIPGPTYGWADQLWLSTSPTSVAGASPAGGVVAVSSLAPGQSYTRVWTVNPRPEIAPGSYYLILQTDSNSQIAETDETNNLFAVPVVVAGTHGISGTVYDSFESPQANVTVRVSNAAGGALVASTTTSVTGTYAVTVPDGTYHVVFIPPQGSGLAVQVFDQQFSTASATPVIVAGADVASVNAFLAPGRAVTGKVTDATGAGLAGIPVDAYLGGESCCSA